MERSGIAPPNSVDEIVFAYALVAGLVQSREDCVGSWWETVVADERGVDGLANYGGLKHIGTDPFTDSIQHLNRSTPTSQAVTTAIGRGDNCAPTHASTGLGHRHRGWLLTAPAAGRVARELITLCDQLIAKLSGTPPKAPDARQRSAWHRRSLVPRAFREGITAIDWTVDERGLADRTDLLQALAYSRLFDAPRVVTLLVYPCGVEEYRSLAERGRALAMARVRAAPRNLEVGLMAVPLGGGVEGSATVLESVAWRP